MLARIAIRGPRARAGALPMIRRMDDTRKDALPLQIRAASSQRPISPHVKIYKFPVAALSSIANRVTGCLLSIGCAGVGAAAMFIDCNVPALIEVAKVSAPAVIPAVKLMVAFPLTYHYIAGVRHLVWDYTLKGLDIKSMEMSSYLVFGSSAAISLALATVSF
ncbi:hypothetical protein AAMO2058_001128800 [Amorphochlora amoebiformis]